MRKLTKVLSVSTAVLVFLVVFGTAASGSAPLRGSSALLEDIAAEREFFIRFSFGENGRDILCAVNRDMGKDSVGLLLLEPSGLLKSLVIDRDSLRILHKKLSIPGKSLRREFARRGVSVSGARIIARQIKKAGKELAINGLERKRGDE
jgi:hypothetical protein